MDDVEQKTITGVVLGVGCPVESKTEGKSMCAICVGDSGLFRLYPIPGDIKLPVWSQIDAKVTKGNDNRDESWKMKSHSIVGNVSDRAEKKAILDRCTLRSGSQDPVTFQNERKKSILIVRPKRLGGEIEPQRAKVDSDWVHTQKMSWSKPLAGWTSLQGGTHKSHIVAREAYETIRRKPDEPFSYFTNIRICNPDWDHWLVMGNMKNRRNVWVVVHIHRQKKTGDLFIPHFSNLISGRPDVWPYSEQQGGNALVAEGQLLMSTMQDT